MTAEKSLKEEAVSLALDYVAKDPDKNLDRLLALADKLAVVPHHKQNVQSLKRVVSDQGSNWREYAIRLLKNTSPRVRKRMGINFFLNAGFEGVAKQKRLAEDLGHDVPFALLIDPTSACNLGCKGCWASDYEKSDNLSLDLLRRVVNECRELGIYFILFSGGEPLVRKDDILTLARENQDMVFLAFTNGTLVDEKFADQLEEVGNFTLAFSIEGFGENTDRRRGSGTYDKVMHAMDLLRKRGVIFGASVTYTRHNVEEVGSDTFIDMLIDKGAAYIWYFTYIPVGVGSDLSLMATPEQRAWMYERVNYFRSTRPIFAMDFWNDGEASGGCIAGGRRYLHINAAGWAEPCAFIHYATDNIRDKSLKEILSSPLFRAYQKRQPFNHNHLRPCPLIDNPDALKEMVEESGARSTQVNEQHDVGELAAELQDYASAWGKVADDIWEKEHTDRQTTPGSSARAVSGGR